MIARRYIKEDCKSVLELFKRTNFYPYFDADITMKDDIDAVVIKDDGVVVGFVMVMPHSLYNYGFIDCFTVDPNYLQSGLKGNKVALLLLKELRKICRERSYIKCAWIMLDKAVPFVQSVVRKGAKYRGKHHILTCNLDSFRI